VTNIRRIAVALDKTLVLPGERLSVNGAVGRRTAAKGYVLAPYIAGGRLSSDIGGGVSQFATTMFNAAFFAGVRLDEHQAHSFYISRYPPGREATINYPEIDLAWTNDTTAPILVRTATTGTSVTVALYGRDDGRTVTGATSAGAPAAGGGFRTTVRRTVDVQGARRRFRSSRRPTGRRRDDPRGGPVTALRFDALFVVCLLGAAVPLALGLLPRLRLPSAVLEIAAGVIIGPSVLGWIEPDEPVLVAALLGLAALLFLAGLEIDVSQAGRRELSLAVAGYAVTLVLAAVVAGGLAGVGWIDSPALVAIALSATSLGLVVPVLKDAGRAQSALGQVVIVGSSTADVASIVLLSVLFGAEGGAASRFVLLLSFCAVVVAIAAGAMGVRRSPRTRAVIEALQDSTAQIRIRLSLVLLVGLTALAARVGLETILGGVPGRGRPERPRPAPAGASALAHRARRDRLRLPDSRLLRDDRAPARHRRARRQPGGAPAGAGAHAGPSRRPRVPAVLHIRTLGLRSSIAVGLLQATSLPFLVAAAMVGRELELVSATTASALIASGVLQSPSSRPPRTRCSGRRQSLPAPGHRRRSP
jgi:hypothetical protein